MSSEVGIRRFKNEASAWIDRVEAGEVITVTRRGKAVARVVPAGVSPGMAKLIAEGKVRWSGEGLRLPKPIALRGSGKSAVDYVIEGRR